MEEALVKRSKGKELKVPRSTSTTTACRAEPQQSTDSMLAQILAILQGLQLHLDPLEQQPLNKLLPPNADRIPIFSGDPWSFNVEDWICEVNRLALAAGWTEHTLALAVRPRLAGEAASLLSTLPKTATWAQIIKALHQQFADPLKEQDPYCKLYYSMQAPTETVWDYYCLFQRMLLRWPGARPSAEFQLTAFTNGQWPSVALTPWTKPTRSPGDGSLPRSTRTR